MNKNNTNNPTIKSNFFSFSKFVNYQFIKPYTKTYDRFFFNNINNCFLILIN